MLPRQIPQEAVVEDADSRRERTACLAQLHYSTEISVLPIGRAFECEDIAESQRRGEHDDRVAALRPKRRALLDESHRPTARPRGRPALRRRFPGVPSMAG